MEKRFLLALVLAYQGVSNVQDHTVANRFKGINFRHRFGEAREIGFEAQSIVDAAESEAEEIAAYAGGVVIQQRGDVDNFRDLFRDEFGDVRLAANSLARFAEFEVAPNEIAEEGGFVKNFLVITGIHAALDANAILGSQVEITSAAKVSAMFVPDDETLRGKAGREKLLDDRRNDCRSGAAVCTG